MKWKKGAKEKKTRWLYLRLEITMDNAFSIQCFHCGSYNNKKITEKSINFLKVK